MTPQPKKALVTGGLGFQGTHLVRALLLQGYTVYALNTPNEHAMQNLVWLRANVPGANDPERLLIIWSSITDSECIERIMPQVSVVFHLAAKINVDESIERPRVFYETNVLGTMNVLDWAAKHHVRVILASTCEVYGGMDGLIDENSPLNPRSPYAASKAGADRMAYAYAQTYGLKVDIVRPFNVYGPLQKDAGFGAVIPMFFKRVMEGEPINIYGDGEQGRDFVYIEDVVRGYMHILAKEKTQPCDVYTFGTGVPTSVNRIVELIEAITGKKAKRNHIAARKGEVRVFIAKNTLKTYFSNEHITDITEGLRKYHVHRFGGNKE